MPDAAGDPSPVEAWLVARGHATEDVRRAEAEGRLLMLVVEEIFLPEVRSDLTAAEATRRARTDRTFADDIWRALGYPEAEDDQELFNAADVAALQTVNALVAVGVEPNAVLDVTRVLGAGMARLAEALVDVFLGGAMALAQEGATEEELADEAIRLLQVDALSGLIDHVFRRQVVNTVRRRFDLGGDGEDQSMVVGFADLTGFTSLSAAVDPTQLNEIVVRFDHQTRDIIADGGGRVVKTIGDEVMFVTDTALQAAEIALSVCETVHGDALLPEVTIGLSRGALLSVMGDYFGPDVNKASRLTGHARPGTVLMSQSVRDALVEEAGEGAYESRSLGRVDLKDLGPTRTWVLRRASED